MDSEQLKQKGFVQWFSFNDNCVRNAPEKPGAYAFRKARGERFGRLKGESDILYIGSTEAAQGLKQRLRQYLHPGPKQLTNQRINEFAKNNEMEVAWCQSDEPGNLEHQLLQQYLKEHDELPPLNHAGRRLLKKVFSEKITANATFSVIKISGDKAKENNA